AAVQHVVASPVLQGDTGDAMRLCTEATAAGCAVFAGDDLTDEHAVSALGAADLGVKVGRAESIARGRVTGPEAMSHMLARLAHLRRKHTRTPQQGEESPQPA
ncbi:hypothetical protein ACVB9L_10890, partial [Rothia kristinae]